MSIVNAASLADGTKTLFDQVTGVWDAILNNALTKDKGDDIYLSIENWTDYPCEIQLNELEETAEKPIENMAWEDAKNNCIFSQPYVTSVSVNSLTSVPIPGTASVVWDNDKFDLKFSFLGKNNLYLTLKKSPGSQVILVGYPKIYQGNLIEEQDRHCARQSWSAHVVALPHEDVALGITYACDTRTFSLITLPHKTE